MIRFDDAIEFLEALADDLAGAGDKVTADTLSDVIKMLDDEKQLHIAKPIVDEGDCLRCPHCFHIVYRRNGRCINCGQRFGT